MHPIQQGTVVIYNRSAEGASLGSGVIVEINDAIYILTNAHCVEHVRDLTIETWTNDFRKARIVGADEASDVAVLVLDDTTGLKPLRIGNSDLVRARDTVDAVGSPLDSSLKFTITRGIISLEENFSLSIIPCFQVDAAINSGNSGGGLFNEAGELIGINSSGIENSGIAFALKINDVLRIAGQILAFGGAVVPGVYFGGKGLDPILSEALGLRHTRGVVVDVIEKRCVSSTVLKFGDVILHVGDVRIRTSDSLTYALQKFAGYEVAVTLLRDGREMQVQLPIPAVQMGSSHKLNYNAYGLALKNERQMGLVVVGVEAGSPAERADFEPGDIILALPTADGWEEVKTIGAFNKRTRSFGKKAFLVKVEEKGQETLRGLKRKSA
ncbi:MAG: PDZ domain-containing protein [Proteobacteria bacterium]|nr:PDZ domain-containing protein [Pseudomonadota bacterium]